MKRILLVPITVLFLLVFASCVTAYSEPTLTGVWKAIDEEVSTTYTFTEDGFYLFEEVSENDSDCYFGTYEQVEDELVLDFTSLKIFFEGKYLYIDGVAYKKAGKKAVNNSSQLCGVWENDDYMLGIASDGLIVSQGMYMNCNTWTAENNRITTNGYSCDYVIINNTLYLDSFRFLGSREVIKLGRKTSDGSNQTGLSSLCGKGPWFYQDMGSYTIDGVLYEFSYNGSFRATNVYNNNLGSEFGGTYTLSGSFVNLSTGGTLVFAMIDGTPFGYD